MNAFDTASREVLRDFLQTAVVIDDRAYDKKPEPVAELKAPGRGPVTVDDSGESPARTQSAHELDTRLLVDTFASKGLVCAIIAPHEEDHIAERLGLVADNCDIVVIDWQLFEDDGKRTRALIEDLCKRGGGDRLRLLCVYSGEDDLGKISKNLVTEIGGLTQYNNNPFVLRKNHVIVTILGKRAVSEADLADALLDRFVGFTKGLLSNAVLSALSGIRRNVHRIIRKFDTELDPSYLSHRIMSNPVDTVEGEILSFIAGELESVVHQSDANSYIDNSAIESWMAEREIQYDKLKCEKGEGPNLLKQLLQNGADDTREGISPVFKKASKLVLKNDSFVGDSELTALLGCDDSKNADRRFAMLSTLETRYEDIAPKLTLGTVIHDASEYLLCLMPRCDSVRVPVEGRDFLFVRLTKDPQEVDLIVEDDGVVVDLGVSKHPYDTVVYRLAPSVAGKPVTARKDKYGAWGFVEWFTDGSVHLLRWVAELKPQIAQDFVNAYASQVCRVGVARSQWLHRLKKKEKQEPQQKKGRKA